LSIKYRVESSETYNWVTGVLDVIVQSSEYRVVRLTMGSLGW